MAHGRLAFSWPACTGCLPLSESIEISSLHQLAGLKRPRISRNPPAGRREVSRTARAFLRGARGRLSAVRRNAGGWQQPGRATTPRAPMMTVDDRRWGGRCRDEPQLCMQMSMRGAMYVTMTMMRPGLFPQREGPGSEPGNSLVRPDDRGLRVRS